MQEHERGSLAHSLDEKMLPFRLARKLKRNPKRGWLRAIREEVGIPVETLAERAGVCRWEIARLEKSEENQRIMLSSLKRAAEGLGCDLVYALVPKQGTLTEMAAAQAELRERARAQKRKEHQAKEEVFLDFIGWRPMAVQFERAKVFGEHKTMPFRSRLLRQLNFRNTNIRQGGCSIPAKVVS